ncbi:hypothetical protein UlMin_025396 [Ulmus minor]
MFYSHQLLARKAPMGQIWMAATMHAKMNRRKLNKLNIIKICEEILNPSIPMALRLTGILMGGVVIVYERKVKLLYDDVTRLLVEINAAWKAKDAPDPTLLPKAKNQAKEEAVTMPEVHDTDVEDIEQFRCQPNNAVTMGFQQTNFFCMRLDSVDEPFINNNEDPPENFHQAEPENITLFEPFDSFQADAHMFNRNERFDIGGEDEMHMNFTSGDHTQMPTTFIPSPPPQDEIPIASEINDDNLEHQNNQQDHERKEFQQVQQKETIRRKTKRTAASFMDNEQTMIPGHVYQSWLQDTSDIVYRKGRNKKRNIISSKMKLANAMELPPTILAENISTIANEEVYYPQPLMELWLNSSQPLHAFRSERTSPPLPPEASLSTAPERPNDQDPTHFAPYFEDFHSGVGSHSTDVPIERQRRNSFGDNIPAEFIMDELRVNLMKNVVTPNNSGDDVRSIPSSASGQGLRSHSERSNKKRPYSSSRRSSGGLEPVEEENINHYSDPNFKLGPLPENGWTLEHELLVETGPTQTQPPIINHPVDKITDSIRMQMKTHFDTPGAPQVESLDQLGLGMNRKGAALLFYQTCVLATRDILKVEQKVPYGEIYISRGAKM